VPLEWEEENKAVIKAMPLPKLAGARLLGKGLKSLRRIANFVAAPACLSETYQIYCWVQLRLF